MSRIAGIIRAGRLPLILVVAGLVLITRGEGLRSGWYVGLGGLRLNRAWLAPDVPELAQHSLMVSAGRAFHKALAHNPGSTGAYYNLGVVYLAWRDHDAAVDALTSAAAADPEDVMSAFQLGRAEAVLGREAAARAAWRRAAAAPYFVNRATEDLNRRDYAAALLAAERAVAADPALQPAYLLLGRVLAALERYPEALDAFETAAALAPAGPEAPYQAALLLDRHLDQPAAALDALDRALSADPRYAPALFERARHAVAAGDCAAAAARLAVLLEPGAPEKDAARAALQVGGCYLDQDDPSAALPVLIQAVVLNNESVQATWRLAQAYERTGNREAALDTCRRVLALNPDHAEAQSLLDTLAVP